MVRLLIAAALCAASSALAQPAPPPATQPATVPLAWLAGSWRGPGTMMGNASQASLEVRPALGGRFLEFTYRAGPFEGRAFYSPADGGHWRATWFDIRGISFGIEAVAEARTLTSDWGSAETERGRTIYRLADDGRLHLTDSVRRPDGGYREFASHVLQRSD